MSALVLWLALTLLTTQNETTSAGNLYKIEFQIANAGILVTGTIDEVTAALSFDETNLDKCSVIASANPKTIRSGIATRDKHLQRKDYFHSDEFPSIRLASISFKKIGLNNYTGKFKLTIKGITQLVIIPISVSREANMQVVTGKFTFNRHDFDLGEKSLILDDKVTVVLMARIKQE